MKRKTYLLVTLTLWALVTWQGAQALEDGPAFKGSRFDAPIRHQSIIITDEGYYPESLSVYKGEKVRFFVTSISEKKQCLILKGKDFFLSAEKGQVSEKVAYFKEPGVIEFYCPGQKNKGHIAVLERPKKAKREIASEKKVRVWIPREK